MDNNEFIELYSRCKNSIERFVYYKMPNKHDAEDVLQEILITGYQSLDKLQSKEKFKSWMLSISSNKCKDYYRKKLKILEVPLEDVHTYEMSFNRSGITVKDVVTDTLENLADKDKLILYLFYIKAMSQSSIALMLGIPIGTVKSRLFKARENFKDIYPYPPNMKGEDIMNKSKFPEIMPEVKIIKSELPPFKVKCEQDIGWMIIPRLGEKSSYASYDFREFPTMIKTSETHLKVENKAIIHGIECVEVEECETENNGDVTSFSFFEKLTNTHIQTIAAMSKDNGLMKLHTFLDEDFIDIWGYGEDNCGAEVNLEPKGAIACNEKGELSTSVVNNHNDDIVGRYTVSIGKNKYDTVRQIYFNKVNELVENYINKEGKVVLFRRFNKFDWNVGENKHYKELWTEKFPLSDRIILNGDIYVHWYNCLPDYVF